MNIILTGTKGCGKSTAANKILNSLKGSVSGFRTVFENRCDEDQTLYVEELGGSRRQRAALWTPEGRQLFPDAFDSFAAELIDPGTDYVFIDELGFLEKDSEALRRAVTAAFDGPQHVVAVIRIDAKDWMQELKKRRDSWVFALTSQNRDLISGHIPALLKSQSEK